jgi:hypothetical protein
MRRTPRPFARTVAGTAAVITGLLAAAPLAAQDPAIARPVANRSGSGTSDTARSSVSERGARGEMSIDREVFAYESGGRRDPFRSLMANGDLKPLLTDLRLVAVAYDESGDGSVAILRDLGTKEQYRVRIGTLLGRMRVAQIRAKSVVFTIEELGYSRQETLGLSDHTAARSK